MPGRTVRKMIAGAVFSHPVIIQLFARFQVELSANHALSVQSGSRRSVNPRILWRCWLGQATPGPRESSRSDPELNSSRLARRFRVPLRRHADVIEPFDPLPTIRTGGFQGPVSTQRRPANIFGQRGVVRFGAMRISLAAPPSVRARCAPRPGAPAS